MSKPTSDPRRLDAAQARRLLSALSLRPGERVLCLGPDGGPVPGVAAILVGPTGRIVEADAAALAAEPLPFPADDFDAVIIDLSSAPSPDHAHLLAEVARVTAPTGRIALAAPPSAGTDSTPVQQLAESAGLRGVAVRTDPTPESDTEPVDFVTAFPPRPATSGDDPTATELHLPTPAAQPAPATPPGQPAKSRRTRLLVAAAAALVVAAAAGLLWGLAGADPGQDPDDQSDLVAGTAELDADEPGADRQPSAEDPPAGGGLPTNDTASDLESDSDSAASDGSGGSGGSGGGQSSNRPPVIDSPGLSSTGLVLHIAPEVSDPDGDDVTLLYDVDGMELDPAQQPGRLCQTRAMCSVELDFADVGYRKDLPVTIIATDSHGATTRQTYSHEVMANVEVALSFLEIKINDGAGCFGDTSRRLEYFWEVTGAVKSQETGSRSLSASSLFHRLADGVAKEYIGEEPPPLQLNLRVTLSGIGTTGFAAPRTYTGDADEVVGVFRNGPCEGTLTYVIMHETT